MLGRMNKAKSWRLLASGIAIGGLAAWLVFTNTDIAGVLAILKNDVDYALAGAALLTYGLYFVGKAVRWGYLLNPIAKVGTLRLTAYVVIGYAGNVILPFQAGEVARGYLLSKRHPVKVAAALSGIAVEKALDFLALLLLLIWALWTLDVASPLAKTMVVSLAGLLSVVGALLLGVLIRPDATGAAIDRAMARCPAKIATRLHPVIHDAISGLAALRQASLLLKLVLSSLVTWGIMLIALYLAIGAVAVDVPIAVAIMVLVLSAVGLALPTSPGFIGTLQAAFVLGMVPFGVAQEAAVAASLLYQVLTTLPPLAVAALCLARL